MLPQQLIEYMRTTHLYRKALVTLSGLWYGLFLYAQDGKLSGTVTNENEPLPAATVSIGNKILLTNQDGKFSFVLEPGNHIITVTHTGYTKIERSVNVEAGSTQDLYFLMTGIDQLDEVSTIGSRSLIKRDVTNRPVPIDILPAKLLQQTGQISLSQMLTFVAPSFNASREVLHEPATLRGLDPQHVLILLNGTRYHNMAWLFAGSLRGQLGRGSVGNDINSIPFSAIDEIEILRDGASAQHGSDAVAGVINIKLRKITGRTQIQLNTGQFYNSDGEKFSLGLYHGFSLGKKNQPAGKQGFMALAANYRYQKPTLRGGAFEGMVYYDTARRSAREKDSLLQLDNSKVEERQFNRKAAVENVGNSKVESYGISLNGAYSVGEQTHIFWTATINERKTQRRLSYRLPKFRNQVNHYLYPDGFQPVSKTSSVDETIIAGIRGITQRKWSWNVTSSYGVNSVKSYASNSNNPTQTFILRDKAPTNFYSGNDIYKLLTTGINFSKRYDPRDTPIKLLNLAWGSEIRFENYISNIGEETSWKNYDPANYPQFGQGVLENLINKSRNVAGAYVEIEIEPAKRLLINIGTRYEYYNDFGGNIGAKFAAIYHLFKKFSLRTSMNSGFRAPSLQQRYVMAVQLTNVNTGGSLSPRYRGIFSNDHSVAKAFGISSLTAEKSLNVSGGVTATFNKNITLTVDAYWIQIRNRIILSGSLSSDNPDVKRILDSISGILVDHVQFFTNAINTRTRGLDIILNGNWYVPKGNLGFALAANFSKTNLFGDIEATEKLQVDTRNSNSLFNLEEQTKMRHGQPASKIILTLSAKKGKIGFKLSNTRFGNTKTAPLTNASSFIFLHESFSSKIITDASFNYDVRKWVTITLGSNNLFDVYPDPIKNYKNTSEGIYIYSPDASPFAFNGGYYYVGMSFNL